MTGFALEGPCGAPSAKPPLDKTLAFSPLAGEQPSSPGHQALSLSSDCLLVRFRAGSGRLAGGRKETAYGETGNNAHAAAHQLDARIE